MKHLRFLTVLSVLSVAAVAARAADFEGTITWRINARIADPAMEAQMQAAQARMASPEMQAQLAQAQAAMNSPEMKAMLEQNPQMRAMMEKQMAALKPSAGAPAGGALGGMMPTRMTMHLRGGDSLMKTEGGMAPRDVLTLAAKNVSYIIDPQAKTYSRMPANFVAGRDDAAPAFKVAKTGETAKILGYTGTRYEVTSADSEQAKFSVWVTPEVKGIDAGQLARMRLSGDREAGFLRQIDGVPLKMVVAMPMGDMTMEVAEIKAATLAPALFALPAGYTETAAPRAP